MIHRRRRIENFGWLSVRHEHLARGGEAFYNANTLAKWWLDSQEFGYGVEREYLS